MTLTRRRFLTITAALAANPASAGTEHWRGQALGADVSVTVRGPREAARHAIAETRTLLAQIDALFSLYDPSSTLSQLNRRGVFNAPDPRFVTLMQAADWGFRVTGGLFDPTVQPLWLASAAGQDPAAGCAAVGWNRVRFNAGLVQLDTGQALTFNGIAQGFATDLVSDRLTALGLRDVLVNIGEYRALGGPWRLAISDPMHGMLGMRTLTDSAIATSSPTAMQLGAQTHILHPTARPNWSTVSVEATTATLADCLSTALCLAPRDQIAALRDVPEVMRITLVDFDGNLFTV